MLPVAPVLARAESDFDASVGRLCELLRIPSISTKPEHAPDVRRAADWLAAELSGLGFEASVRPTGGHPALVAHHPGPGNSDLPHLLYYAHYDVQPAEPLELWNSLPFEPAIVEAQHGPRIVARGAVDDKGQLMTFIEAFRAWHAVHATLPVPVTVLLDGEEESGSPNLKPFLLANRDDLKADVCILTDSNSWDIETPAITARLRGVVYVEATLHGPSHDVHCGRYGGAVLNPITALTRILGRIHDDQGRVRFPGFYDDVREPSAEELAMWRDLGFDEAEFLAGVGLKTPTGETGRTALERIWSRPTCEICGIWGGYTGEGSKTMIAAKASVKFSCRLVPGQDPAKILDGIRRFLEEGAPPDARWEFKTHVQAPAIQIPTDSRYLRTAMAGLSDVYAKRPVLIGTGGTIPVVGHIREVMGIDSILVGFGLSDDRIHSPNEKFELKCLRNGIGSHVSILARFAEMGAENADS